MNKRKVSSGGQQVDLIPNGTRYSNSYPSYTEFKNTGPLLEIWECKLLGSKVIAVTGKTSSMPYYIQLVYKAVP